MGTLFRIELIKTFRRFRSAIGYGTVIVAVPLLLVGLRVGGRGVERELLRGLEDQFFVVGRLFNGYTAAMFIMNGLWVHVPFLITLVAGDIVSGEAVKGTLRVTLTRRPSRAQVLLAKYAVAVLYATSLVALLALLSVGLGRVLLGGGDLLIVGPNGIGLIDEREAPRHLLLAYGLGVAPMWAVASLAFLIGTFVENAIGPIVGTMGIVIVLLAVTGLPIPALDGVRPWLFTSYFDVWQLALEDPIPAGEIAASLAVLAVTAAIFTVAAFIVFCRRDVLS